ncbi:MAG: hypothetical protein KF724_00070 [Phycisphaeraceae bacterium]|nr:hypothetical protein [Phycisphaeraceae bacterium]
MLPKPPPREGHLGFIYSPPYRIQGISVAGEQTSIHIPELDLAFDAGLCPRPTLTASTLALSHAHMDHSGGIPYYFSQRTFQKLGTGRVVCHPELVHPLRSMMASWVDLERQRTPHEITALAPGESLQLRPNLLLRGLEVSHTGPSLGFAAIETRSKLRPEFHHLPQDKIRELKLAGTVITQALEIPLIAYTGDTEAGPFLFRDEFAQAPIVITECTFFESDHRDRAKIGKHLHVEDLKVLLKVWSAREVIVIHVSRRTHLGFARERLREVCGDDAERIHLLMDHRANRARYDRQVLESGERADVKSPDEPVQESSINESESSVESS